MDFHQTSVDNYDGKHGKTLENNLRMRPLMNGELSLLLKRLAALVALILFLIQRSQMCKQCLSRIKLLVCKSIEK